MQGEKRQKKRRKRKQFIKERRTFDAFKMITESLIHSEQSTDAENIHTCKLSNLFISTPFSIL